MSNRINFVAKYENGSWVQYLKGNYEPNAIINLEDRFSYDPFVNEYFRKRLPLHFAQKFLARDAETYLSTKFIFRCKLGEREITIGDLVVGTLTISSYPRRTTFKNKIFRIFDWFLIHDLIMYLPKNTEIELEHLYRTKNMFHSHNAIQNIEREILNLIVNKRLGNKMMNRLRVIELYTTYENVSDLLLDRNLRLVDSKDSAAYICKYRFIEGSIKRLVKHAENGYFNFCGLNGRVTLTSRAVKSTMIIDFILKNNIFKASESLNAFKQILEKANVDKIAEFLSITCAYPEFLDEFAQSLN
jgi:hypothetical protein